jgi:hypothetical protein
MTHLFAFTSSRFKQGDEPANPINPIGGEGVLRWLRGTLDRTRFVVGDPDTEDWGWYTDVQSGPRTYLLGASGEWAEGGGRTEWVVQLHLHRTLWERLTGANKLADDDDLSAAIEAALRNESGLAGLTVERGG